MQYLVGFGMCISFYLPVHALLIPLSNGLLCSANGILEISFMIIDRYVVWAGVPRIQIQRVQPMVAFYPFIPKNVIG